MLLTNLDQLYEVSVMNEVELHFLMVLDVLPMVDGQIELSKDIDF